jgi:hypothetical protein
MKGEIVGRARSQSTFGSGLKKAFDCIGGKLWSGIVGMR